MPIRNLKEYLVHSLNRKYIELMTFALDRLNPGGFLVIEDIMPEAKPIWRVVAALLPATYRSQLVHVREALCFVTEKIAGDA